MPEGQPWIFIFKTLHHKMRYLPYGHIMQLGFIAEDANHTLSILLLVCQPIRLIFLYHTSIAQNIELQRYTKNTTTNQTANKNHDFTCILSTEPLSRNIKHSNVEKNY